MELISLASAAVMTQASESTFRRRIADGTLPRIVEPGANGRSMVPFEKISADICIPLDTEDLEYLFAADTGSAEGQSDMGTQFLFHKMPRVAIYWFEMAIKQEYPEAMYWLGRCHLEGEGVEQSNDLGMMWIARAAAAGHIIAKGMMEHIIGKVLVQE